MINNMKLEHIALTINYQDEILNFYQGVLGMELIRTFTLNSELANTIFKINHDVPVYLLKKNSLVLEVFVSTEDKYQNFNHICISVSHRESFVQNAADRNYTFIRKERDYGDLIFLSDLSGNMFEIKEMVS